MSKIIDPTDSHSLEELRAHLGDGGDMQPDPADVAEDERDAESQWDYEEAESRGFYHPKTRDR